MFNDPQRVEPGAAKWQGVALLIAATVVSTAVPGQVVVDAGSRVLGGDRPDRLQGYEAIPDLSNAPLITLDECYPVVALDEYPPPPVGSVVHVVPNHVCPVVNLFDRCQVVSGERLVDQWPIEERGHLA